LSRSSPRPPRSGSMGGRCRNAPSRCRNAASRCSRPGPRWADTSHPWCRSRFPRTRMSRCSTIRPYRSTRRRMALRRSGGRIANRREPRVDTARITSSKAWPSIASSAGRTAAEACCLCGGRSEHRGSSCYGFTRGLAAMSAVPGNEPVTPICWTSSWRDCGGTFWLKRKRLSGS
jgi:hypothetical protein